MNKIRLNQYFSLKEFECPCCHKVMLSEILLEKLFRLRYKLGKPIIINSGYRCEKENHRVGGVLGSYHLRGMAADIHVQDIILSDLLFYAQEVGFTGIGFYEEKNFLHLDIRSGQNNFWKGNK